MLKAVFFDWDFTLVDPKLVLKKMFVDFCDKQGIDASKYNFDELMNLNARQLMRKFKIRRLKWIYIFFKYVQLSRKYQKYYDFSGHEILNFLEKNKIPYVIITDNFRQILKGGFDIHPEFIVDYFNTRGKKLKGIRKALKKMGLKPHEVCYVGDKPSDITAANEAGVMSVGILTTHTRKELEKHKPKLIIKNINELKKLFK